jgi:3-hydroxyethyl bacteriochlorophyllide a dehydrogenase
LAATARHAIGAFAPPDLIVGHGVLGRLLARVALALGAQPPTVWETNPERQKGGVGYPVIDPGEDPRQDYRAIYDVSGDAGLLGTLIGRLGRGGEVILAGFYDKPLSFDFPPAFMREAKIRIAAEWRPEDLDGVMGLLGAQTLSLDDLITHRCSAIQAPEAYRTAFTDPSCLKMVLDWRGCS